MPTENIEITLGDQTFELKPTFRAVQAFESELGGLFKIHERLEAEES